MECFNNLVMLNNASLFYRLENGRSPDSLTDLAAGRFADTGKIVCPHGGAYAWDAEARCLHLLAAQPPAISHAQPRAERADHVRRASGASTSATRSATSDSGARCSIRSPCASPSGRRVKLETCVLPTAPGSIYQSLRGTLDAKPRRSTRRASPSRRSCRCWPCPGARRSPTFFASCRAWPKSLAADPTLTDLSWLGDRVELHYCDASTIVEVDPTRHAKMLKCRWWARRRLT